MLYSSKSSFNITINSKRSRSNAGKCKGSHVSFDRSYHAAVLLEATCAMALYVHPFFTYIAVGWK